MFVRNKNVTCYINRVTYKLVDIKYMKYKRDIKDIKPEQQTQGKATKTLKGEIKLFTREQASNKQELNLLKEVHGRTTVEVNGLTREIKISSERIE